MSPAVKSAMMRFHKKRADIAEARIKELEAALKPFAELVEPDGNIASILPENAFANARRVFGGSNG